MHCFGLRDDQSERIENLLPGRPGAVGVTAAANRIFVKTVLYRYRTGGPRCDLPARFGDWKNVSRRFSRWAKSGVWERVLQHLAADADNEYAMIDSAIVRAHQHRAGAKKDGKRQAIGRSGGGLGTKIHALVDALDNPINFFLMGGEAHDLVGVDHLFQTMQAAILIADKAFDADKRVIEPLAAAGKAVVIPSKANRVEPSPRATIKPRATSRPPSISLPASFGSIDGRP